MDKITKRRGPPTKYNDDYPRMAKIACEEGGLTDIGIAKLFNVCKATITIWKREYPEFKEAVRAGKEFFDTQYVEKALLKRAIGYSYSEVVQEADDDGNLVITRKLRKHLAGDVKAQVFWLRNRSRKRWPDTQKFDSNVNVGLTHEELLDQLEESPSNNPV